MLNVEIFTQSYTEFFLKGIVLRELHRGVLLERVSGFKFQVCGTKFTTSVHFRTGREVLHRDARIFLEKDYVEESYTEELHFDGNMDDADLWIDTDLFLGLDPLKRKRIVTDLLCL
jgi:hypothetical protein